METNQLQFPMTYGFNLRTTVESLYLEPLYLETSLSRTKYLDLRKRFQANFLSLSRTLSISNKYFGPLKVRDEEILMYIRHIRPLLIKDEQADQFNRIQHRIGGNYR